MTSLIYMKKFLILIILFGLHTSFPPNYGNYEFPGNGNYGNYGNYGNGNGNYGNYGNNIQANNLSCTYPDHYCNPTATDLIRKVEDTTVQSVGECSELCKRWQTLRQIILYPTFQLQPLLWLHILQLPLGGDLLPAAGLHRPTAALHGAQQLRVRTLWRLWQPLSHAHTAAGDGLEVSGGDKSLQGEYTSWHPLLHIVGSTQYTL